LYFPKLLYLVKNFIDYLNLTLFVCFFVTNYIDSKA
jgi:hypothetical protein